jgi:ATPase subunit of ABC transporter with duplicated ATPase domains
VTSHPRLKLGYYTQNAVQRLQAEGRTDSGLTALGMLARAAGDAMTDGDMRGLLGSFGLPGRVASDVPVAKLSGGQLVRCLWESAITPIPFHFNYEGELERKKKSI